MPHLPLPLYESWGRLKAQPASVLRPASGDGFRLPAGPWLAWGNGRSYGDTGLPAGGTLIDMRGLSRIIAFDPGKGVLRAEAGAMLGDILARIMPLGWFLPVTPGTRHVTLGGALANDVHGKNHHRAGTFGRHVRAFGLLRSDGVLRRCAPDENAGLFAATIGGMGLTGLVTWVEIALKPVASADVVQETIRLDGLADFFALSAESDARFDYVVSWIDSLASGRHLGRGLLMRANHAPTPQAVSARPRSIPFPFDPPVALLNRVSLSLFNAAYRGLRRPAWQEARAPWESFFYPLDRVEGWNRAYGPKGLRQFQCVLPHAAAKDAVREMLERSQRARHGSFLTVLKSFGDQPSTGLLSFPRPGMTLTLDFPYRGEATDRLLAELDAVTLAAGGAVNPYKDARMSAALFRASFPDWQAMLPHLDPMARSVFATRVGLVAAEAPVAAEALA